MPRREPTIEVDIDKKIVSIPVSSALRTNFLNQFVRDAPSQLQRNRYRTLMSLIVAAYRAGQAAGQ